MPDPTYDNQNIFAKILRGEAPCIKVYEDEHTLAFMDIMPQADGHVLVLPKEGAAELFDLSDDAAAAAIRTTRKLARAVRRAFTPPGIAVFQLNGSAAGQTV
ncbi:HIT domain-containing protein, partial [Ralstonia pseudosolanacearum]